MPRAKKQTRKTAVKTDREITPQFTREASNLLIQQQTVDRLNGDLSEHRTAADKLENELRQARLNISMLEAERDCEMRRLSAMTNQHTTKAWEGVSSREAARNNNTLGGCQPCPY